MIDLPVLSTLVLGENALRMNSKKIFKREGSTIKYSNTILLDSLFFLAISYYRCT